jgi:primosomal protein N' (replication factor Y)
MFVTVVLDSAVDKALDYAIPPHLLEAAEPGKRVLVPVRGSMRKGMILALKDTSEYAKVHPISEILSEKPVISAELFSLARWMARYYCTPLRKVLSGFLPPVIRKDAPPKTQLFITALLSPKDLLSQCVELRGTHPLQAQVLDILLNAPKGVLLSELLEKAGVSRSPVETLIKKKLLACRPVRIDRSSLDDQEYFQTKAKSLHAEQTEALKKIQTSLDSARFETHLIHGVTGSGKTEIYLQAIEHALRLQKGAILLVPEIALTAQTLERLRSRFAEKIAILHHRLSAGERQDTWHHIRDGRAQIVVGARSALFSPVPNLGLIVVDEEQENSYKQTDEAPCYHARDVAVMRGKLVGATVVLGSATPCLESYHNALSGKYTLSTLKERAGHATLPIVTIVDMKKEFAKAKGYTLFSEPLIDALKKRCSIGEQSLLFLNRRGFHTAQTCTQCAHAIQCPHCDVSLTFHLGNNLLACHLCDYRLSPPPRSCPNCHAQDSLKYKGAGTEMVERALHALLPDVRTLRLDADTTRHKGSHELLFKQFRAGKADVLIGTQMIAKGLHFPSVTLVGVLYADASLNIPDFRAAEQTFQLITQISGRSGRGTLPGEVLLQTHLPDHSTIRHAAHQDFDSFYREELDVRKLFHYPPFTHLAKLTFSGTCPHKTQEAAHTLRRTLIQSLPAQCEIHPVIPCGHAKIKDRYRFQLLIKGPPLGPFLENLDPPKDVRLLIDIDPLSTYF